MLNSIDPPLCFNFVASVRLKRMVWVIFVLALLACLASSLPLLLKTSLSVLTIAYFIGLLQRLKKRQYTFRYTDAGSWEFSETKTEAFVGIEILPSSVVTNYAVFLHFQRLQNASATQSAVLLAADSLTEERYRAFIVKLLTTAVKHRQALQSVAKINPIVTPQSFER